MFTVAPDVLPEANGDRHVYFATPLAPGQAFLRLEGGGVRDSATVNVLPQVFGGVPSSTELLVGDEYRLLSTSVLKFDPDSTDIIFGEGECGTVDELEACPIYGLITKRNADTLTVIVPEIDGGQPARLTVENVVVTYVTDLKADLPTAAAHNIQNRYSDSDAPAPADPDANFTITAGGAPIVFYDGFRSSRCVDGVLVSGGSCDRFYKLTLPAAATFTVKLEWDTDADVDLLFCNAACSGFVGNIMSSNVQTKLKTISPTRMWLRSSDSASAMMLRTFVTMRELMAFAMITLGVMVTKWNASRQVIRPLIASTLRGRDCGCCR